MSFYEMSQRQNTYNNYNVTGQTCGTIYYLHIYVRQQLSGDYLAYTVLGIMSSKFIKKTNVYKLDVECYKDLKVYNNLNITSLPRCQIKA